MGSCQSTNVDGSRQNMRSAIEIKTIQVDDEDKAAQKKRLMKVLLLGSFHTSNAHNLILLYITRQVRLNQERARF
jgi:hypothetical protein